MTEKFDLGSQIDKKIENAIEEEKNKEKAKELFKDFVFVEQHKQMCGSEKAKQMLEDIKKQIPNKNDAKSVYLDAYGNEVHVNGPVVSPVTPYETLQQKIARFDALAANVAANRALMAGLKADFFSDEETEEEEEKAMEEIESVDDFGDSYVVKTQQQLPLNQQDNVEEEAGKQPFLSEPQTAQAKKGTAAEVADDEALSGGDE